MMFMEIRENTLEIKKEKKIIIFYANACHYRQVFCTGSHWAVLVLLV